MCSDKLFVAGNSYSGRKGTRLSVVRYGNVVGSRGSVIPLFKQEKRKGVLPITDNRMTRFWITLDQGARFVIKNFERMVGGEIFVPKIPSMKIIDLAKAIAPNCKLKEVGIRPGEKLHEVMVSEDNVRNTKEFKDYFIIKPSFPWWNSNNYAEGKAVPDGFKYSSDTNDKWLTINELRKLIKDL